MADSKLYSVLSGLYNGIKTLNTRKDTLSSALSGYTEANAVSSKFEALSGEIKSLKETGADNALTGLISGTGITLSEKADHQYTISVTDYDTITGAINGYTKTSTISSAISELSTNVFGDGKLSATLRSDIDTNKADIDNISASLSGWTLGTTDVKADVQSKVDALSTALVGDATTLKTFGLVEDEIDSKLSGIETSVTGYIADKISELSLNKALTGVVDPKDVITLGIDDKQQLTGSFLYDSNEFKVDATSHKLGLNVKLSAITTVSGDARTYALVDNAGNKLGADINIPKDQFLSGVEFVQGTGSGDDSLKFTFELSDGKPSTITVPLSGLFDEYSAADGIALTPTTSGINISAKKDAGSEAFLYITSAGIGLSGIQAAIDLAQSSAGTDATNKVNTLEGKLSAAFVDNHIVLGTATGITSSDYTVGLDTLAATPLSTTIATELAVDNALNTLAAETSTKWNELSGLYSAINELNGTI